MLKSIMKSIACLWNVVISKTTTSSKKIDGVIYIGQTPTTHRSGLYGEFLSIKVEGTKIHPWSVVIAPGWVKENERNAPTIARISEVWGYVDMRSFRGDVLSNIQTFSNKRAYKLLKKCHRLERKYG